MRCVERIDAKGFRTVKHASPCTCNEMSGWTCLAWLGALVVGGFALLLLNVGGAVGGPAVVVICMALAGWFLMANRKDSE